LPLAYVHFEVTPLKAAKTGTKKYCPFAVVRLVRSKMPVLREECVALLLSLYVDLFAMLYDIPILIIKSR